MKNISRIAILAAIALAVGTGVLAWEFFEDRETPVPFRPHAVVESSRADEPAAPTSPQEAAEFIGAQRARELVLQKAGLSAADVVFDRTELDRDDGIWQYEVEFRHGRTEYSADVNATDGTIREWDVDRDNNFFKNF